MSYTYRLLKGEPKAPHNYFSREELERLATIQLQKICAQERIITRSAYSTEHDLSRQEYIELILRYRGRESEPDFERFDQERIERLEDALRRHGTLAMDVSIMGPEHILLKLGQSITHSDGLKLSGTCSKGDLSAAFLLDDACNIRAVFSIGWLDEAAHLLLKPELVDPSITPGVYYKHNLLFFSTGTAKTLLKIYQGTEENPGKLLHSRSDVLEVIVQSSPVCELPLVIDFGAHGTTAGCCRNGELYRVRMRENPDCENARLGKCETCGACFICPSAAAVKSCATDDIRLSFGYDAIHETVHAGFLTARTVLYDLKLLSGNLSQVLQLSDGLGNHAEMQAGEILRQFINWVLKTAQADQRCTFSTVCLLERDHRFAPLTVHLAEHAQWLPAEPLDAGFATMYNELKKRILNRQFDREYQALLFHVGSSRTQMTLLEYHITEETIIHKIYMRSRLVNVDVRFGGDGLTYRIMQYLKIWLAEWYGDNCPPALVDMLGEYYENPFGGQEDGNCPVQNPYEALDRAYAQAESRLPTRFALERNSAEDWLVKVKSNFFSLWKLAERIKINFYSGDGVCQFDFGEEQKLTPHRLTLNELWSISVRQGRELHTVTERPPLIVTRQDVDALLAPAVYQEVAEFVMPFCDEELVVLGYDIVLSGLSARIPLFRDAFKEFTVGGHTRNSRRAGKRSYKLNRLDGALKFIYDRRIGQADLHLDRCPPLAPYRVSVQHAMGGEITILTQLQPLNTVYQTFSRYERTKEITFSFYRGRETRGTRTIVLDSSTFTLTSYQGLWEIYDTQSIPQAELDGIREEEIKFFVYNREYGWGIFVLPVLRRTGNLFVGKESFLAFENNSWEVDFFGGCL